MSSHGCGLRLPSLDFSHDKGSMLKAFCEPTVRDSTGVQRGGETAISSTQTVALGNLQPSLEPLNQHLDTLSLLLCVLALVWLLGF